MSQKIALISSLKFRPAHISHLIASYKQFEDLGYKSMLFIHPDFIPFLPIDIHYCTSLDKELSYSVSLFWFPCLRNIRVMCRLRYVYKSIVLYVIHEPAEKYSVYRNAGNSHWETMKIFLKNYANVLMAILSHKILLPSQRAVELYKLNRYDYVNKNYNYFPLIYDDECLHVTVERKYFSYIGNIHQDHAFDNYIGCISFFEEEGFFEGKLSFLIATKSVVKMTSEIRKLLSSGRLVIVEGKPMSNEEINSYYQQSYIVWNAYSRSTQSGVLVKSFMFGTPAIIMRCNKSEFVQNDREVVVIDDNTDYREIANAVNLILENFQSYSSHARETFERYFYYKKSNKVMATLIGDKI